MKGGLKTELALPPCARCASLVGPESACVLARSSPFADWRQRFRGERTCSRSPAAGTTFSSFHGHVSPVPGNLTREGLGGDWGSRAGGPGGLRGSHPGWRSATGFYGVGGGAGGWVWAGRGSFGSSGPSTPLRVIWAGCLTPLGWVWPLRRRGSRTASGADSLVLRAALLSSV